MGKDDVVHIYDGVLFRHTKNRILSFMTTQKDVEGTG